MVSASVAGRGLFDNKSRKKERCSMMRSLRGGYVNLHLSIDSIVDQQVMSHSNPVWFHRMSRTVVVIAYIVYREGQECKNATYNCHRSSTLAYLDH